MRRPQFRTPRWRAIAAWVKTRRRLLALLAVVAVVSGGSVWGTVFAQERVPHALEGRDDCLLCHSGGGPIPFPEDHADRSTDTCLLCHVPGEAEPAASTAPTPAPAPGSPVPTATPPPTPEPTAAPSVPHGGRWERQAAPAVPHALEGRDNCRGCHSPDRTAPADHEGRSSESCLVCHGSGEGETAPTVTPPAPVPAATPEVPHTTAGRANCLMCHDTQRIRPFPPDHLGRANAICEACHQSAGTVPADGGQVVSPVQHQSLDEEQRGCLSCHGDENLAINFSDGRRVSLYVDLELKENSAHRYIRCTTCHSSDPHEVESPLSKLSLSAKCGACHQYQYELHLESVHGRQLAEGNSDVATCTDCHSADRTPHSVVRVLEASAPAYKKNTAETCGQCHGDEELMSRYGIVEKVYETYMRSFHGKALQLTGNDVNVSQLDKATCTNCHGTHDISSPSDPDSPVAGMENLARVCEQCHPGAGVEFASGFLGHQEASPDFNPGAYYTERFLLTLTAIVVAMGLGLVLTTATRWALRGWKE